jgi:hypothetical protein
LAENKVAETPQSPEVHEDYVKEDLDQDETTHVGEWRTGATGQHQQHSGDASKSLGAMEDEVVPVVPPMSGPADVVGENNENAQGNESGDTEIGEETFDPRDELTPG